MSKCMKSLENLQLEWIFQIQNPSQRIFPNLKLGYCGFIKNSFSNGRALWRKFFFFSKILYLDFFAFQDRAIGTRTSLDSVSVSWTRPQLTFSRTIPESCRRSKQPPRRGSGGPAKRGRRCLNRDMFRCSLGPHQVTIWIRAIHWIYLFGPNSNLSFNFEQIKKWRW